MKKNNKRQFDDKQFRLVSVSEDRSGLHRKHNYFQGLLFDDTGLKTGDMLPQKKKPVIH